MSTDQLPVLPHMGPDSGPALRLDLSCQDEVTVITVRGELDMGTAYAFDELVGHVAQARPARVVLDLAEVTFFCADGLNALLNAHHTVAAAGGQLVLRAVSAATHRVLALTRTEQLFPIDADGDGRQRSTVPLAEPLA